MDGLKTKDERVFHSAAPVKVKAAEKIIGARGNRELDKAFGPIFDAEKSADQDSERKIG
ncbi:MAG: hypothetical protein M1538_03460 [Candidatus Marsarchaeota archaeon]|jgi:hypothetical protein|nr:hypothetical protein [Candidatus Marsarchaeota archaeon]